MRVARGVIVTAVSTRLRSIQGETQLALRDGKAPSTSMR
jgi:hypothetical protein